MSLRGVARSEAVARAEALFWTAATTQTFPSAREKAAFRARWFANYVSILPNSFLVARVDDGEIAGYLAGCIDTFAPANGKISESINYYTASLLSALSPYPSHFHVNVVPKYRGRGIGKLLADCFAGLCASSGSTGLHVVTGSSSAAKKFYTACGLNPLNAEVDTPSLSVLVRAVNPP